MAKFIFDFFEGLIIINKIRPPIGNIIFCVTDTLYFCNYVGLVYNKQ